MSVFDTGMICKMLSVQTLLCGGTKMFGSYNSWKKCTKCSVQRIRVKYRVLKNLNVVTELANMWLITWVSPAT